jgi:hypothetical protein
MHAAERNGPASGFLNSAAARNVNPVTQFWKMRDRCVKIKPVPGLPARSLAQCA